MILNETVAAIADAIREKKGTSELIKPIDFAEEIKGITAGGTELEGDYFLAKANEYYWKLNFPVVERLTFGMPEYDKYRNFCNAFTQMGATFECVSFDGLRSGYKDTNFLMQTHYNHMGNDSNIINPIIAIRESDIDNPTYGKYRSLVELYKAVMEQQGTSMTDEEVVALIEEMGITRITKEEFEALITA